MTEVTNLLIPDRSHLLGVGVSRQQSQSSLLVSGGGLRITKTLQQRLLIHDVTHTIYQVSSGIRHFTPPGGHEKGAPAITSGFQLAPTSPTLINDVTPEIVDCSIDSRVTLLSMTVESSHVRYRKRGNSPTCISTLPLLISRRHGEEGVP